MFGRLLIPVETDKTLLIPKYAVIHVGQLELVNVQNNKIWQRVYIKTGRIFGEKIEVLSGLWGVIVPAPLIAKSDELDFALVLRDDHRLFLRVGGFF